MAEELEYISKSEAEQLIQKVVDGATTPQEALDALHSSKKEEHKMADNKNITLNDVENMSEEDLKKLLGSLNVNVSVADRAADAAKAANQGKDDRFILTRLIEDYGAYMGAAALTVLVIYWLRTKFSGSDATEAGAAALAFITGK